MSAAHDQSVSPRSAQVRACSAAARASRSSRVTRFPMPGGYAGPRRARKPGGSGTTPSPGTMHRRGSGPKVYARSARSIMRQRRSASRYASCTSRGCAVVSRSSGSVPSRRAATMSAKARRVHSTRPAPCRPTARRRARYTAGRALGRRSPGGGWAAEPNLEGRNEGGAGRGSRALGVPPLGDGLSPHRRYAFPQE